MRCGWSLRTLKPACRSRQQSPTPPSRCSIRGRPDLRKGTRAVHQPERSVPCLCRQTTYAGATYGIPHCSNIFGIPLSPGFSGASASGSSSSSSTSLWYSCSAGSSTASASSSSILANLDDLS